MSRASTQVWFRSLSGNARGALFMVVAASLYSVMAALIKFAGQGLPVIQILLVRQVVMTIIVAPAVVRSFPGSLATRNPGLQFLRVVAAIVAMVCGFGALVHLPLANATAIAFSKSFFTTIFAIVLLGEVVGWRRWMAVVVGFAGVIVMAHPGTGEFSVYSVLAVVGALAAGFVMVIIRYMARTDTPLTILTYQAIFLGLAVAGPAIYYWQPPTPSEWFALVGVGAVGYVSQMANIMAYKEGEASVMAIFDYLRLIFAVLLGFYAFGEVPDLFTGIGAVIVVGSALYTVHRDTRRKAAIAGEAKA
ncbi:DMT family transporter [Pararhizobium mangrovi]|uniref:DMT family transporter n=1 Tax=Pararhizobium mangrovi TaxID=2590452 RepID=A0A506UB67_9HYPH|nr:DMT family transporter [Pararhizobium mangrovi]TPW29859.1 DMT family transporter [Pararhizobium mangrovi]